MNKHYLQLLDFGYRCEETQVFYTRFKTLRYFLYDFHVQRKYFTKQNKPIFKVEFTESLLHKRVWNRILLKEMDRERENKNTIVLTSEKSVLRHLMLYGMEYLDLEQMHTIISVVEPEPKLFFGNCRKRRKISFSENVTFYSRYIVFSKKKYKVRYDQYIDINKTLYVINGLFSKRTSDKMFVHFSLICFFYKLYI